MKYLHNFSKYNEDIDSEESLDAPVEGVDGNKYSDIKDEITEMIKTAINSTDKNVFNDFIDASIKNPEETQIEGLINDSEVYEFYLKFRNDIDSILSDINFYDEVPSEIKVFSLYDYIIKGTKRSISEVVSMIKE